MNSKHAFILALAFGSVLSARAESKKEPTQEKKVAPKSYYKQPLSYSSTRDPDVPKYAKHAADTEVEFLKGLNWLDVGLDYRVRLELRDDDIRRPTSGFDSPTLHRLRGYVGIHDILDPFRFAVEFQDAEHYNSRFTSDNRDVNQFELIRLQAELHFDDWLEPDPHGNDRPVFVRYGIQNFEFLDRRLLGNNQWRNTANTFLGFRGAIGQDSNDWSVDALAVQPLDRLKYEWDEPVEDQWVYALIGHWRGWSEYVTFEPFYLLMDQGRTSAVGAKTVHAPGIRAYGTFGDSGFDFDASYIRQFGDNNGRDIEAWGGNVEIGYRFKLPWKPRLSAFYGYASGDKDPNDGEDNRFERFYGFGRPWSANDYIVFENIKTPKLRMELTPSESIRVDFGYSWYALASSRDRFYGANRVQDKTGRSGDEIGQEFDIRARWQVNRSLEAVLGYAHFTAGEFTRNKVRGDDTDFGYLELNYSFF